MRAVWRAVRRVVVWRAVWRAAVTSFAAATGPLVDFMVGFFAGVLLIRDFFVIAIVVSPGFEIELLYAKLYCKPYAKSTSKGKYTCKSF
jgi:hypothetical protein